MSCLFISVLNVSIIDAQSPMEARLDSSPYVSHHTSIAVHGQDITQLCQLIRIPEGSRPSRQRVQLSLRKFVLTTNPWLICISFLSDELTHIVVYAGYFFGQYPCGWLIGRYPAQKVMAISIFLWGLMVIIMTQSRTYSSARKLGNKWRSIHNYRANIQGSGR